MLRRSPSSLAWVPSLIHQLIRPVAKHGASCDATVGLPSSCAGVVLLDARWSMMTGSSSDHLDSWNSVKL